MLNKVGDDAICASLAVFAPDGVDRVDRSFLVGVSLSETVCDDKFCVSLTVVALAFDDRVNRLISGGF